MFVLKRGRERFFSLKAPNTSIIVTIINVAFSGYLVNRGAGTLSGTFDEILCFYLSRIYGEFVKMQGFGTYFSRFIWLKKAMATIEGSGDRKRGSITKC